MYIYLMVLGKYQQYNYKKIQANVYNTNSIPQFIEYCTKKHQLANLQHDAFDKYYLTGLQLI